MKGKTFKFEPLVIDEVFDVVVVGGGLAGVMAAISAAREGKKVIIAEKHGSFGGMATAGMVYPFMRDSEHISENRANAGLYLKMLDEIHSLGGSETDRRKNCKDEYLKVVLDRMVKQAGVKVLFRAKLCGVDFEDGNVKSVSLATVSGVVKLYGKVYIDATGNADLVAFAGLEYQQGRDEDSLCQPMTLCFRLAGVDWSRYDRMSTNAIYKKFREEGKIKNPRENVLVFRYPVDGVMHMNTTRAVGYNPVSVEDVSDVEILMREQMMEMLFFLRENIPGMENCDIISSAPETGIRESRRIVGLTQITVEDVLGTKKFEDSIARGTYDIDIHNPSGTGTVIKKIPPNDFYTIPYRALIPVGTNNLLAAGRSVCSTHEALSAIRVMPITACIGEAAGIAAAMAAETGSACKDIDIPALRGKITAGGGLV